MNTFIKYLMIIFTFVLIYSCEDSSLDMDWRKKNDFISKNGDRLEVNQVEESGLMVYDILRFLLNEESKDTLEIISSPLPWDQLKEQKINLDLLKKIKNEYIFEIRGDFPYEENKYPTFFTELGTFPKNSKNNQLWWGKNNLWRMKNHEYSFQNDKNENVEISFFNDPTNIPIKTISKSFPDGEEYKTETTYYTEIQYIPKDKKAKINTGKVSFDIYAKTGYTKLGINEKSIGKTFSIEDDKLKIVDFKKDFAVYELLKDSKPKFKVLVLSENDKRYKKKRNPNTNDWLLSKRSSGVMGVNKVVWNYVKSIDYKLEKEPFLAWFATEVMSKRTSFSKKEKEEKYQVAFAVGEMEHMILYKEQFEKTENFHMELK